MPQIVRQEDKGKRQDGETGDDLPRHDLHADSIGKAALSDDLLRREIRHEHCARDDKPAETAAAEEIPVGILLVDVPRPIPCKNPDTGNDHEE